ncbi:MAG: tetratricopeptide (TPR) repeat protein [Polaribacter sp.]|jgi:tetratricopeptide (TPR) repeat protein
MTKRKNTPKFKKADSSKKSVALTDKSKSQWIPALVIGLLAFLLYANTLGHSYVLDDFSAIKDNFVTQQGVQGIPTILKTSYRYGYWNSNGSLYRPVSLITFALEWQIAPDSPGLSHFVNVLLYALTGMLLFFTLSKIFKKYTLLLPFLATVLFIAHPVHTEVVANIKSRDEILAFLFCLGALYFLWDYLKSNNVKPLILAVVSYTLAMFSKENAITFLAVIPLLIYCFTDKSLTKNLMASSYFLIPIALYFTVRYFVLGGVFEGSNEASALDNLLMATDNFADQKATAFVLLGKYLVSLFLPVTLISEYGFPQMGIVGWSDWRAILSFVVLAGLGVWALMNLRKQSIPAFGILYFIITFSVFANVIILIGSSFGERFLYMASLGFTIALAWGMIKWSGANMAPSQKKVFDELLSAKLLAGLAATVILLYSARTVLRNPAWENSYSLYSADITNVPNSAKLNYHHGLEQVKKGLALKQGPEYRRWIEEGMNSYTKAIELYPAYHDAYGERGLGYFRMGQLDKAIENYKLSIKHKPNNSKVYSNMGIIYFQKGELDKAKEVYEKAVEIDPRFVDARRNLGSVYAQQKRFDAAIAQFTEALKYDPDNATLHQYMGFVYRDKGDTANAKVWLDKAKRLEK